MKQLILNSLFLLFTFSLFSQDLSKYNREKERLSREIELAGKLIDENQNLQRNASQSVTLLNSQIVSRQKLINNYNDQINILNNKIANSDSTILKIESNISISKEEYAELIKVAFLQRNTFDFATYILSSESFNQAYQRYRMYNEINSYREGQVKMLSRYVTLLDKEKENLIYLKSQLKVLMNDVQNQHSSLQKEKLMMQKSLKDLRGREKYLIDDLEKKRKQQADLEHKIVQLIQELASKSSGSKAINSEFEKNKGLLGWPVSNAFVVSQFGEHEHPVLKGVMVKNNGIDIQVSSNLNVSAVFAGEVSRIVAIPGYNKAVIIRHGKFLTVYANMQDINVKQGQKINSNDIIGTVFSNSDGDNSNILHFELWKENFKVNPIDWLKK